MRTLEEIKRDLQSFKNLAKRQRGATLYAEKYVEDVGALVDMIEGAPVPVATAEDIEKVKEALDKDSKKSDKKAKTPKS